CAECLQNISRRFSLEKHGHIAQETRIPYSCPYRCGRRKMSARAVAPAAKVAVHTPPQAVSGTLQRQCACGQHAPGGVECESCKQGHAPLQRFSAYPTEPGNRSKNRIMSTPAVAARFQTKLLVGRAGDMYEQEADSISQQVMTHRESLAGL